MPADRVSAFSLVNQSLAARGKKDYIKKKPRTTHLHSFSGLGAMVYGSPLSPFVPAAYPPYMWPHLPGLFLPYSPLNRPLKSLSPEQASSADNGYMPEKARIGKNNDVSFATELKPRFLPDDDAPLNLSLKNYPSTSLPRKASYSIWSPGSICEKEDADKSPRRSPHQERPDSSSCGNFIPEKWMDSHREGVEQVKIVSIGPGGERTFKVRSGKFAGRNV